MDTDCEERSTMTLFPHPEIWKQRAVLSTFTTEAPIQRFNNVWVSFWGQCRRVKKTWMSQRVIMKVQPVRRSLTLIILIRKDLLNLLFLSIVKDMGGLIRQVMHENIWYLSYKIRKSQFSSYVMKDKRKDRTAKFFNKLKHPSIRTCFGLSQNIRWFALSSQDHGVWNGH